MRYLTLDEVLELHRLALAQSGGLAAGRPFFGMDCHKLGGTAN